MLHPFPTATSPYCNPICTSSIRPIQVSEKLYHKIMLSTTYQVLEYLTFLMVINTEVNINQAYPLSAKRFDEKSIIILIMTYSNLSRHGI
jgi:hypothetical protein